MEDNVWKNHLTSSLCDAWKERLCTDLTIVSQDEVFHAHKLVLSVSSPYFRALLNTNFSESQTHILKIQSIPGRNLKIVLEYVYSGRASLTEENATEILVLAEYFQIYHLKRLCCRFLKSHMSTASCLPIYELASLHNCHDLANFAFQKAVKNCSEVLRLPSFLTLEMSTVVSLLKQQVLGIESEDELFEAILAWTVHNEEGQRVNYFSLLALLNEDQLSPLMRRTFRDEMEEKDKEAINSDSSIKSYKTFGSRSRNEEEFLIVFGGESNGQILGNGECFSIGYTSWQCSIPRNFHDVKDINVPEGQRVIPPMKQPRSHAAVACKDNIIFIIGGKISNRFLSSCESFHVDSNQWGTFPDIPLRIHGAQAVFLQDKLWVIGGSSDSKDHKQDTLIMYDPNREKWCYKSPLLEGRFNFGAASIHECIYVVGGMGMAESANETVMLSSCEMYDVHTDSWIQIASLNHARANHGVAVIDDFIYAIGGYDRRWRRWLTSVERYDPLKDQWTIVSPTLTARSNFGVTVSNGRIYCIGGFNGEMVLNTVEKYNPRTDMWHCVQSMQFRRFALSAATFKHPCLKLVS